MNGYNLIAPYYQFFVKLVFGDLLFKAQTHFLTKDLNPAHILIVGGGTGELLEHCLKQYSIASITYVESSEKMIRLSEKRISKEDIARVDLHCESIFEWNSKQQYDLVLLPFVFDLFNEEKCIELLEKVQDRSKPNGSIIVTDFFKNKTGFQIGLVRLMYFLFTSVNASERTSLPLLHSIFLSKSVGIIKEKKMGRGLYSDMIITFQLAPC